jgi:hypothetical protein
VFDTVTFLASIPATRAEVENVAGSVSVSVRVIELRPGTVRLPLDEFSTTFEGIWLAPAVVGFGRQPPTDRSPLCDRVTSVDLRKIGCNRYATPLC